jgi:hypothetical protein
MGRGWVLLAVAVGCSSAAPPPPHPEPRDAPPLGDPALDARKKFESRGGMWMPQQLGAHAATLRALGLGMDLKGLSDPLAYPLGAVVSLGGCSASFVSASGLIVTNHHCATPALSFNATKEKNLLETGFLAKSRSEEPSNGPAERVFVTQAFRDVTSEVRAGLEGETDPKRRHDVVEQRQKDLVAACEKDRTSVRCTVESYFGGESFALIELLEIRDVRLVYAPAEGIGNYGGEIDNWRWPRHGGDYTFYRAYVGPDGQPADYDPKNVPYRPRHHLRLAKQPLVAHDLVMVAGYPARTSRLKTAVEVAEAVEWFYPWRIEMCNDYIALLEKLAREDEELDRKGRLTLRQLSNILTNTRGMVDGLVKGGLKGDKERLEGELVAWAESHPEHAGAKGAKQALANIAKHHAHYRSGRDEEAATLEMLQMSRMVASADNIVRMAEERQKPDAERHPSFQERNWKRMQQGERQAQQNYARRLDREKLQLALLRASRLPKEKRPRALGLVLGEEQPTPENIAKRLDAMYAKTKLEDAEERVRLLTKATVAEVKRSRDPFIVLARSLRPILQSFEDLLESFEGELLLERPRYIAAMRAKAGGLLAPDANRTLRVTYGTVRGYRPTESAPLHEPFTSLSGMLKKHRDKEPFDAPDRLVEAARRGPFAPYLHPALREVPVDFLSDCDITGGNSGSATINENGELVGLAFDGNYEAMASDWIFMPDVTRAIHVDMRYALWIMDRVDGADHLLEEMGHRPAL